MLLGRLFNLSVYISTWIRNDLNGTTVLNNELKVAYIVTDTWLTEIAKSCLSFFHKMKIKEALQGYITFFYFWNVLKLKYKSVLKIVYGDVCNCL